MALSNSLKNILKTTKDAGKKLAGSINASDIAKAFDEDGFSSAVKKTTQPIVKNTIEGAKDIGGAVASEIGETTVGKKVTGAFNTVSESVPGRVVKKVTSGTVDIVKDFYKANTYDHIAYEKAMDDWKDAYKNMERKSDRVSGLDGAKTYYKEDYAKERKMKKEKPKQSDFKTGKVFEKDLDTFIGYRRNNLTTGSAIGLGVGAFAIAGAGGLTTSYIDANENSKYGYIYGDVSVGTVNATFSPTHDKLMNSVTQYGNVQSADDINDSLSSKMAGVNPKIVFALHQLRNNKFN